MSEEAIKRYRRKYKKDLMTYTFPENYYDYSISDESKGCITVNERRNINIIRNTPKDICLFEGKFIYYERLRSLNNHINEWIEIYNDRVKFVYDINLIYKIYLEILNYINNEICVFIKECKSNYNITYPIINDTLVKNYIDILIGRKLKIKNTLRVILESEFNLHYREYSEPLMDLFNYYQGKILSIEKENMELYNEFRNKVNNLLLTSPKSLVREKKEK